MSAVKKRAPSLKWQMAGLALTCWLVPVVLVLCVMGWYVSDNLGQRSADHLADQFQVNVRMSMERLDGAVRSSRRASYDGMLDGYRPGEDIWPRRYASTDNDLGRQYQGDQQFSMAAFWFNEDPEQMRCGICNTNAGGSYQALSAFWKKDFPALQELANRLDTYVAFYESGGHLYLVRNMMDHRFQAMGVLVLELDRSYYFDNLTVLPWAESVRLELGEGAALAVKGEAPSAGELGLDPNHSGIWWGDTPGPSAVYQRMNGPDYALSALAMVDTDYLLGQSSGYKALLLGMALFLLPLLFFVFWFFNRKISRPIQAMTDGAIAIEEGALGYQMSYTANSREFQYLTDSFNHMSGQLQSQFDHIYQEELALRDARIKALQSHINPHFLNNTLEIINWESRMNGDAKVSKMIESLSTVLDAAIDRDKRPEVRLAEEMTYVSAYLYIIDQRFGRRLSVNVDIPDALMDCMVPRLILQPVIENAVEHGIGPGGSGTITLRGRREGNLLLLDTENDGGLSAEDEAHIARLLAPEYDAAREPSGNLGISNVNQRLRILYGPPSGLTITRGEGSLVVARITIALEPGKEGSNPSSYPSSDTLSPKLGR